MSNIRSPIVSVLGHVDHGKSSILDAIRKTNIIASEAGAITQAIGASIVPLSSVKERCGELLDHLKMNFTIPGLLFIDTPGHAAFTSLRKRGGALADIAILVIDINEGFKPQTIEAIEILKNSKTPFILAANKLDLTPGYVNKQKYVLQDISAQSPNTLGEIEKRMYELVGKLHENFELNADRFDRVSDYTKQIAIVPCSALKGVGIPELLMVVTGLAQKYLEEKLQVDISGNAKGTVLEVKEEKGLGTTIDVIVYDGKLKVNDNIVVGGLEQPIVTKVRALLEPNALSEMRDKKAKFQQVKEVVAATGVKISAPGMENVLAGMPLVSTDNISEAKEKVQKEIENVLIETGDVGVVVKADSIGSLEALLNILKEKEIPVARATVGNITKIDITTAEATKEKDPLLGVILGFNVSSSPTNIKVIISQIIYSLIDDFEKWQESQRKEVESSEISNLITPAKIEFLKNHTFRQNNPAVIGVEVLAGTLKVGTQLMKEDGKIIGTIKSMQLDKENARSADKGKQLALSLPDVTVGRQIHEGNILISAVPEDHFRKLKNFKKHLKPEDLALMKEIATIMRDRHPVWGV